GKRKKTTEFYKALENFDTYPYRHQLLALYPPELLAACQALQNRLFTAIYLPDYAGKNVVTLHELSQDKVVGLQHKMNECLQTLFNHANTTPFYIDNHTENNTLPDVDFKTTYTLSVTPVHASLSVRFDNQYMVLKPQLKMGADFSEPTDFEIITPWLLLRQGTIYKLNSYADLSLLQKFEKYESLKFKIIDKQTLFNQVLQPLSKNNVLQFENTLVETISAKPTQIHLYLKEFEKVLLFVPKFIYTVADQTVETDLHTDNDALVYNHDKVYLIKRDLESETEATRFFKTLHPDFEQNHTEPYFHLTIEQVMHQGWFFKLFEQLKQNNIAVFGQQELKKIKYNTHKPIITFGNSSGTDWLDLQLKITFGQTQVSLNQVRKAILNNQKFVPLDDGTVGLLPDEWVTRYAPLFKYGKLDKTKLSISKLHFTIIDTYLNEINNDALAVELQVKKNKLLQFESMQHQQVPAQIQAQLRPYQVTGFEWLHFLNDFNWGGCLADDMGLGKTLQVLTLLQHLKNNQKLKTSLVVVPTT
ncbi:MAG TPA: SNF2-related protein, partial [Bacteroidia bacterium]|nr:SNF2-related protein [Bacteroidia bacterium]